MCRLFKNLGFNNKYVIFDLPSFSLLQKFYLKSFGDEDLTLNEFKMKKSGILCISELEELKSIIKNTNPQNKNLFIGAWSISEIPLNLRNDVFQLLDNINLYLLAYQDKFKEVDNIFYFNSLQKIHSHINKWYNYKIEYIPGNRYLIGKRD